VESSIEVNNVEAITTSNGALGGELGSICKNDLYARRERLSGFGDEIGLDVVHD